MYYVYQYVDPRSHLPFYIGKGCRDRKYSHLNETNTTTINMRKHNKIESIKKAGLIPIIEELAWFDKETDAYDFETKLIIKYGRKDIDQGGILTNLTLGNIPPKQKGKRWSNNQRLRHKQRMKEVAKKRKYVSKDPWNKGLTGVQVPWNKGLTGMKGNQHSEKTKQTLREKNLGKKKSQETRAKMSRNMKGRVPWNKGKSTPNVNPRSIRCIFVSPDNIEYEYTSVRKGCLIHSLPTCKMSEVTTGKLSHYKGWTIIRVNGREDI